MCEREYLHSEQCVDAVSEVQFGSFCWLLGDPQVQETNTEITLITEDRLLYTQNKRNSE